MKDNWKEISLVDLALFRRGSFPQPYGLDKWYDDNNGMPFIQVYDVDDNMKLKRVTKRKISKLGAQMSVFIPKGSLILTIQGSIGRVAITDYDAYMDRTLLVFQKFYEEVDLRFIMYIIKELFNIAKENANGSTIKTITKEELSDYTINLPPLPQQKKIAKILSTVDKVIEKTESAIAKYQAIKQGLMHDLFTRGIDVNTGKLRPTQQEAPELYKESALGWIPKDWKVEELGDLSNKVTDGTHFTPNYTESGVPFLRVTDVQTNKIEFDKIKYVSKKEHNELIKRCHPERGDILYSKNGTIGIPKLVDWDWEFSIFVSLALIKPKKELIKSEYLLQLLPEEIIWKQIRQRSKQGTVTNLHLEEIREFLIPLPSKQEQEIICKRGVVMKNKIKTEQQALAKYKQLKAGLLQDLLTGNVEVSV